MKIMLLAVFVPDCFEMKQKNIDVHLKGMSEGSYCEAVYCEEESEHLNKKVGERILEEIRRKLIEDTGV